MTLRNTAIATLLITATLTTVHAQSLDSALSYFPLAVGNTWEYSEYWGMTAPTQFTGYCLMRIASDTLMPNDKRYFVLRGGSNLYGLFDDPAYLRLDSSAADVRAYKATLGQEYTWDSLLARPGNIVHHQNIYLHSDTVLETPTVTRSYVSPFDGFGLSYGFGVTYGGYINESQSSYAYKLVYAKIGNLEYGTILGVAGSTYILPAEFELKQNFPNPFNPSTTIRYALPTRSHVTLTVFNTLGQAVATLVNESQDAGYHDVRFDASGLASGVYFYRLSAGDFVATKRLALVR